MKPNRSCGFRWLFVALAVFLMCVVAFGWPHKKVVHLVDSHGASVGSAVIRQHMGGVRVYLNLRNLPPGVHAIHFHQTPSCVPPDFKSSGGHFNPTGKHHGLRNPAGPHAGDMPNFTVAANGRSRQILSDDRVTLRPDVRNSLFANGGTALVIHAGADDMVSDPAGNAGPRIACGVITR